MGPTSTRTVAAAVGLGVLLAMASLVGSTSSTEDHIHMIRSSNRRMGDGELTSRGRILTQRALAAASDDSRLRRWVSEFRSYIDKYGKDYASIDEAKNRLNIYVANVKRIAAHNRQSLPYKLGINEFTDMTFEEFRNTHLMQLPQACSATKGNHVKSKEGVLPKKVDWREKNIVSPVKNQGNCGSCWTFSATGAMEAAWAQATGQNVSLSEQQLVDCAYAFSNHGCMGGLPSQAFEYIHYNGGLDTEASYPYTATDGKCHYKSSDAGAKVYDVVNITMGNEEELKDAVAFQRPVSIAFEVMPDFQSYSSGVYSSPICKSGPKTVNHAVLAVGYVAEKGKTPYWIVKNSWGEAWGLDGYFFIEQGKDMCGLASCASYPVVAEC